LPFDFKEAGSVAVMFWLAGFQRFGNFLKSLASFTPNFEGANGQLARPACAGDRRLLS
jgi:hypothetical protein